MRWISFVTGTEKLMKIYERSVAGFLRWFFDQKTVNGNFEIVFDVNFDKIEILMIEN